MFSSSVDAGFVVALPFYRYLEPDCVGISMRGFGGGLCAKKMQEELMRELRDTTVIQKKTKKKRVKLHCLVYLSLIYTSHEDCILAVMQLDCLCS